MNIKTVFCSFVCLVFIQLSYSQAQNVSSEITSASLFRDGALVTREASIDVDAGKSTIRFENLPTNVDRNTLQAEVFEGQNVIVRNAKLFVPEDAEESESLKALRESLRKLNEERAGLVKSQQQAKNSIEFAVSMGESFAKNFGVISEGISLDVEQAKKTWAYIQETTTEANAKVGQIGEEIRVVDEKIEDLNKELQKAIQSFGELRTVGEIELEASTAQSVQLSIGYIVNAARWEPRYELRARPAEGLLDFGYFANVWQKTGEDWGNVSLTLHTNQVNRQGNAPELQPLRVNQSHYRPYYSQGLEKARTRTIAGSVSEASDLAAAPEEAVVSSSSVSFQVQLPGSVDVPSSNDQTSLPLLESALETEYWSEVVPKLQLDAYLKGKTVNSMELPILPGEAIAFVDDKLSSRVRIQKTLPEEELELSLGVDANIGVKRKEGVQKTSDSGFLDKTTTLRREYYNEVGNFHSVDHTVVIIDQFPVSQNAKIEVRRLGPSEPEVEFEKSDEEEQDLGIFKWTAILNAQETKTFTTQYEVVYPRDWHIWPEL